MDTVTEVELEHQHALETIRQLEDVFREVKERYFSEKISRLEASILQVTSLQDAQVVKLISTAEATLKSHLRASQSRHAQAQLTLRQMGEGLVHSLRQQRDESLNAAKYFSTRSLNVEMAAPTTVADEVRRPETPREAPVKPAHKLSKRPKPNESVPSIPVSSRNGVSRHVTSQLHPLRKRAHAASIPESMLSLLPAEVACLVYRLQPAHIDTDLQLLHSWTVPSSSLGPPMVDSRVSSPVVPTSKATHLICDSSSHTFQSNSAHQPTETSLSFRTQQLLKQKLNQQIQRGKNVVSSGTYTAHGRRNGSIEHSRTLTSSTQASTTNALREKLLNNNLVRQAVASGRSGPPGDTNTRTLPMNTHHNIPAFLRS